jgi:hypothetical protein
VEGGEPPCSPATPSSREDWSATCMDADPAAAQTPPRDRHGDSRPSLRDGRCASRVTVPVQNSDEPVQRVRLGGEVSVVDVPAEPTGEPSAASQVADPGPAALAAPIVPRGLKPTSRPSLRPLPDRSAPQRRPVEVFDGPDDIDELLDRAIILPEST